MIYGFHYYQNDAGTIHYPKDVTVEAIFVPSAIVKASRDEAIPDTKAQGPQDPVMSSKTWSNHTFGFTALNC